MQVTGRWVGSARTGRDPSVTMSPRCTGRSFTSLTGQEPGQRSRCPHLGLPKDNKPAVEEPSELGRVLG